MGSGWLATWGPGVQISFHSSSRQLICSSRLGGGPPLGVIRDEPTRLHGEPVRQASSTLERFRNPSPPLLGPLGAEAPFEQLSLALGRGGKL
eukprot:5684454-Pyramimonas_sp.AAC.1